MRPVTTYRSPNRWVFFALAGMSLLMFSIDSTIVAVALPTMTRDLETSLAWIGWTITAYMLTQTVTMPLAGKLSESFGRVRTFVACVALFTLGSLLCGLAPNVYALIFFRAIQALGGGGLMPSATGLIAREFPHTRDRMIGLFTSIFPLGGIIGPNVGGFIIEHFSWREVFLVNVPIGLVVLLALVNPARQRPETRPQKMDLGGAALLAGTIVALLGALTWLGNEPSAWHEPSFWGMLAASGILLYLFIRQEARTPQPMIDLHLVAKNPFLAVNIYNFFFGACVFGFFSFIPYFGVLEYHMGTAESGAVLTPRSLTMVVMAFVTSMYLLRLGYRLLMCVGLGLVALTLAMLSQAWQYVEIGGFRIDAFWVMAVQITIAGIGMGLAAPASNNAVLDLLPERAAMITGLRGMFRSVGAVIGTALIVLALEFSPDRAEGLRTVFLCLAVVLVLALPITFFIPDTARQRRQDARRGPTPETQPARVNGRADRPRPLAAETEPLVRSEAPSAERA